MPLERGSRIGRYEILSDIGTGGMSEVYRARDLTLGREVALKILRPAIASRSDSLARFEKEAKSVAALSHQNVVSLYDFGVDDGVPYLTMELLDGETLRAALLGPMPWNKAARIATAIAEALRSAHARGIVHRDLKPENVFLTRDGTVKVLDFGLAQGLAGTVSTTSDTLTAPGTLMGTAAYMSPEQIRGEAVTPASDLFALGCVLYELLAGVSPFRRDSPAETLAAILRDEPPDLRSREALQIPEAIIRVVEHALEKLSDARFQSAADFIFALTAAVEGSGRIARDALPIPRSASPPRRISIVVAAMLFVAIMTAIALGRRATDSSPSPREQPPARSLAVLPFENSTGDRSLAYLTEGLTEGVINDLSPVTGFKVLSRNTVFSYRPESTDPRRIGADLGVDAVVTGRVSRHGGLLIVGVELTDTRDRHQIWGERYERRVEDVAQIERELSHQISEKLQMRLGNDAQGLRKRQRDVDPDAYRLYLQGRYEWNKRTPDALRKGIALFRESIDKDATFAPAHAGIADSYLLLGGSYEALPPREAMPIARKAAQRALELDPELAEAHASLALIAHEFEWDWPRAEAGFRRAIELNPNSVAAQQWYGQALLYRGRPVEAMRALERAEELDPLSLVTRSDLAQAFWIAGHYDRAIVQAEKLIDLEPRFWLGYWFLGLAQAGKGDFPRAIEALERALQLGGSPAVIGSLGYVRARAGQRDEAMALLEQLNVMSRDRYVSPAATALIYIGLGDLDHAFEQVERAIEQRSTFIVVMNAVPLAEPIRNDPRYGDVARRVGLPPIPP